MFRSRSSLPALRTSITPEDFQHLEVIKRLLRVLNDPYAGDAQLRALIDEVPVLAARCIARARHDHPLRDAQTVGQALPLIGNRGLEAELLRFLEDLTVAKADSE